MSDKIKVYHVKREVYLCPNISQTYTPNCLSRDWR